MSSKAPPNQDADELILLDIQRKNRSISQLIKITGKLMNSNFVPLTIGEWP